MEVLEILPGISLKSLLNKGFDDTFVGNIQIGRHGILSENKTSHFKQLLQHTNIPFSEMLFFDDCNWGDNCQVVCDGCPGVTAVKTPFGLTVENFQFGLKLYADTH